MDREKVGAGAVIAGMAGFLLWCFWPKPCPTCISTVKCPSGDFPAVGGVCPDGYVADTTAAGCCMPAPSGLTGCPTCPALSV